MRRTILITLAVATLAASGCAARGAAGETAAPAAHVHQAAATTGDAARRAAMVEAANMFPVTGNRLCAEARLDFQLTSRL
jgi:hypothetical protein